MFFPALLAHYLQPPLRCLHSTLQCVKVAGGQPLHSPSLSMPAGPLPNLTRPHPMPLASMGRAPERGLQHSVHMCGGANSCLAREDEARAAGLTPPTSPPPAPLHPTHPWSTNNGPPPSTPPPALAAPRAGTAALTREDIAPALEAMERKLMERNVAEEIAEKWVFGRVFSRFWGSGHIAGVPGHISGGAARRRRLARSGRWALAFRFLGVWPHCRGAGLHFKKQGMAGEVVEGPVARHALGECRPQGRISGGMSGGSAAFQGAQCGRGDCIEVGANRMLVFQPIHLLTVLPPWRTHAPPPPPAGSPSLLPRAWRARSWGHSPGWPLRSRCASVPPGRLLGRASSHGVGA